MNDNLTIRKIIEFTIPGSDDGVEFVNLERLNLVMNTLVNSNYGILGDKPLSKIFQHQPSALTISTKIFAIPYEFDSRFSSLIDVSSASSTRALPTMTSELNVFSLNALDRLITSLKGIRNVEKEASLANLNSSGVLPSNVNFSIFACLRVLNYFFEFS